MAQPFFKVWSPSLGAADAAWMRFTVASAGLRILRILYHCCAEGSVGLWLPTK